MSLTSIDKDYDALTITALAEFDAAPEQVWQLWADPRKLERWWGPPTYPATVEQHELVPGGSVTYFMTGPDGETYHGWWEVLAVDPPKRLEFRDGFAEHDGRHRDDLPVSTAVVRFTGTAGGTRMEMVTSFLNRAEMDEQISMGAIEGAAEAMSQMDAVLAG
ncbi:SRPBCC domain-containing protein [Arthrobacter sp. Sa2BUA2]|uniref:SRPBCC domain-containing protein n=1 Tax=Arthrobacter pullicola TaxID=2762224 RepID=A0ABR8YF65_9MICC|nr:SRPBCC domain-containing protein [Arthrobacter pullicola]MBD8042871.1 SRPBCC domain-containing protein [Arthrobacter pullicola]